MSACAECDGDGVSVHVQRPPVLLQRGVLREVLERVEGEWHSGAGDAAALLQLRRPQGQGIPRVQGAVHLPTDYLPLSLPTTFLRQEAALPIALERATPRMEKGGGADGDRCALSGRPLACLHSLAHRLDAGAKALGLGLPTTSNPVEAKLTTAATKGSGSADEVFELSLEPHMRCLKTSRVVGLYALSDAGEVEFRVLRNLR